MCSIVIYEAIIVYARNLMIIKFLNIQNWVAFLDGKKQNIQFFPFSILHRTRFGDFQKIETTQWSTIVVGLSNNSV